MTLNRDSDRLLKVDEVAELVGLTRNSIYSLSSRGQIPSVRIGTRTVRFREGDVAEYIDGLSGR